MALAQHSQASVMKISAQISSRIERENGSLPASTPTNGNPMHNGQSVDDVLVLEELTHCYGETVAVDGVSFSVARGEIFGLLGHNGAGKTTTVRLLNGLLVPTAGRLTVNGLNPAVDGLKVRAQTGVLTESPSLDERLSARQNLRLFARMYGMARGDAQQRVEELLDAMGMTARGDENCGAFSRGMKQRVALARAMLHRPSILFLDEPASGLDPVAIRQLHELILYLSREEGVTVVLCTHNLDEAQSLCNRVAVLQTGRLMALGSPRDLALRLPNALKLLVEVDEQQMYQAAELIDALAEGLMITPDRPYLVVTGAERGLTPLVSRTLVEHGIDLFQLRWEEPALEDVYFALHNEDEEGATGSSGEFLAGETSSPVSAGIVGEGVKRAG